MNLLDQLSSAGESAGPDQPTCSRKACRNAALWQLLWNNPAIHTPQRRKIWLACGEHVDWLQEYLQTRSLWKETRPLVEPGGDAS